MMTLKKASIFTFVIAIVVVLVIDILLFKNELTIEVMLRVIFMAGVFTLVGWYLENKKSAIRSK